MTVKEAISILQTMNPDSNLVAYSPCGPDIVEDIRPSWDNEVIVDIGNGCCEHILDCHSNGSKSTIAQAAHRAEVEARLKMNGENA